MTLTNRQIVIGLITRALYLLQGGAALMFAVPLLREVGADIGAPGYWPCLAFLVCVYFTVLPLRRHAHTAAAKKEDK